MDDQALHRLLRTQCGVVGRAQLLALGEHHDIERMLRRRELTQIHPRVFINHTGELTPAQREWAAVLYAEPAALYLGSAMPDAQRGGPIDVAIDVAIDETRRVKSLRDVRVHRVTGLEQKVLWNVAPPRVRLEHNVLELVHRAPHESDAIRLLTDAVGSRRTTPSRLRTVLELRTRMSRRRWVLRLLDDIERGTCSVLEHGYLTRVERPHGLPRPTRQVLRRGPDGQGYRDVEYEQFGLVVELDGRTGHAGWDNEGRDADRDLDDLLAGRIAARVRWAQVYARECRTAERIGRLLQQRGWSGSPRPCGPGCTVAVAA